MLAPSFIADFSYTKKELLKLKNEHEQIILLDHHMSAQKELEGLSFAIFDMTKSGAVLSWEYLFPEKELPLILKYVEDRDLWRFKLPNSKRINNVISMTQHNFKEWNQLVEKIETNISEVVYMGDIIETNNKKYIRGNVFQSRFVEFDGHKVPCTNASNFHSETGHELLDKFPEAPFAVIWLKDRDGKIQVSLRSRGDFDVSELARKFGGGGHKAASGCIIDFIP